MSAKTRKLEEAKSSEQDLPSNRFVIGGFLWLFALLFAYYYLPLTQQADFYISDTSYFFEPFSKFIGEQLKQGVFPLWNPLMHCGMSQLAVPSPGLFYPPSYLLFLLPFSQGLSLYMIFHQLLFAIGAYLYLKELGLNKSAALLGAFALGLSSYCFVLTRNPTLPATIAWLPLSLFLQNKISGGAGAKQIAFAFALAFTVAMQVAAGRPEIFLPCIALILANCFSEQIADLVDGKKIRQLGKLCLARAAALVTGLGLAGPVILPALEWSALSPRAHGLAHSDVLSWSANAYDFASMLLSFPVGDICSLSQSSVVLQNLLLSKSMSLPFVCSSYIGPVILSFAVFAFFNKEFKVRFFLIGLLVLSVLLAAGSYTPLAPFLLKVFPALAIIRYPVKLLIFPALILSFAAAVGFDLTLKRKVSARLPMFIIGLSVLVLAIALATYCFPYFGLIAPQYLSSDYGPILRVANLNLANSMSIASLLGIFTGFASIAWLKSKISAVKFAFGTLVAASTALFLSSNTFPYLTAPGFYKGKSTMFAHLAEFLNTNAGKAGVRGRIMPFYTDGLLLPEHVFQTNKKLSYEELYYAYSRTIGRFNTALDFSIPQSFGYEAAVTAAISSFYGEAREYSTQFLDGSNHPKPISDRPIHRFCKLTGTEYVMTQAAVVTKDLPLPEMDDRYFELYGRSDKNNSRIYTVLKPRPRIHYADEIKLVDNWDSLRSQLCNSEEIADDKISVDYLLNNSENQKWLSSYKALPLVSRKFTVESDSGQSLQLKTSVEGDSPQVLFIQDQYYPGWKAEIDGKHTDIRNANIFSRAIEVPPGEHTIKLYFAPDCLRLGFVIQALSIAFLFAVLLLLARIQKRTASPQIAQ